ncbi:hypothetical protein ACFP2T_26960 [Plantactinospora solaniradicis]|uniref:Uncharacterized protein n=1 Tax=Plantactinospora solaniradicis TaxID=1723736 RepID=A0ABW1KDG2_9ACTN
MSTFMGLAWIDLVSSADSEAALVAFRAGTRSLPQRPRGFAPQVDAVAVELSHGRYRIESWSDGNYEQLADLVVQFAEGTGLVSHAFVALDHDEYGAEHIVIDACDGAVRRAYHYFAYPRDEDTGAYYTEGEPSSVSRILPGIEEPATGDDPGVLVDGPVARATIAARYGVPVAAVDQAAAADRFAHGEIGGVGDPCARWRDALGLAWPGESQAAIPG